MHRVRHGEPAPREAVRRPRARASSSRKNGLPSALSRISLAERIAERGLRQDASARRSGCRPAAAGQRELGRVGAVQPRRAGSPGRYVVSSMTGAPARLSTSAARHSSDVAVDPVQVLDDQHERAAAGCARSDHLAERVEVRAWIASGLRRSELVGRLARRAGGAGSGASLAGSRPSSASAARTLAAARLGRSRSAIPQCARRMSSTGTYGIAPP